MGNRGKKKSLRRNPQTRKRVNPGYKAGAATKDVAMNLSGQLWTVIQQRASDEVRELMYLQSSLDCILWDIGIEDSLGDPLAVITRALEVLDELKRKESPDTPEPVKS